MSLFRWFGVLNTIASTLRTEKNRTTSQPGDQTSELQVMKSRCRTSIMRLLYLVGIGVAAVVVVVVMDSSLSTRPLIDDYD